MWCAVHVRDGGEAEAESFMAALLPESFYEGCFHLTRHRRKKYGGRWRTVQETLLPGYVFIATDKPEAVHRELKKAAKPGLLFSDGGCAAALEPQESDFLKQVADENGVAGISGVEVEPGGRIRFLSGPLLHAQDYVTKVSLHQRTAKLEADFMGRRRVLYLGIEIAGR